MAYILNECVLLIIFAGYKKIEGKYFRFYGIRIAQISTEYVVFTTSDDLFCIFENFV